MEADAWTCHVCGEATYRIAVDRIRDWEFGVNGVFQYRECETCGVFQLHPFPTIEALVLAYPDTYTAFVQQFRSRGLLYFALFTIRSFFFERFLKTKVPSDATVLDVGCGNGEFLTRLRSLGASRLLGIDFHPKAIELARAKGIETFQGVFTDYPGPTETLDLISMINYIEHVLAPKLEIKKAYELLKSNGYLIGELPNFAAVDRLLFGRYWGGNHVPRHTFQYTPNVLRKLLEEQGFTNITIRQDLGPGHLVLTLQNWLQRNEPDLKKNPKLLSGRMKGFSIWLLILLPVHTVFWCVGRAGAMTFSAQKP